nr:immunoglobulin heavy chain junction region [Mus musculus]MBK4190127.1 immunoglobulin heavy chain junction region [Mus musculus]MBK4190129.1 immunoglobulin heavy chain junction region [Mus musculus]MBK4190130.1 immunoglobulin heavy chain junction region [Mus musculus]MBK4190133.1 immunoglobulin heavy chain junction region [Mus musculus]
CARETVVDWYFDVW